MKKTILAVAALAVVSGSAFAHNVSTPTATLSAGAAGLAGVSSSVSGAVSAGLAGGSSQTGAESLQTATVAVTSGTSVAGGNINGAQAATIGAVGTTSSQGFAYNLSTGDGAGSAAMTGQAYQGAAGSGATSAVNVGGTVIPSGSESGSESSIANENISATTNQGAAIASVSGGNFGADVGFTTNSTSVSVPTSGNTVTTQDGQGVQLTAGSIGGAYAQTSLTNGVYADGSSIDFGGNSNQIPTTVTVSGGWPFGGSTTVANPALVNSASGAFGAQSSIDGTVSNGTPVNVSSPL